MCPFMQVEKFPQIFSRVILRCQVVGSNLRCAGNQVIISMCSIDRVLGSFLEVGRQICFRSAK